MGISPLPGAESTQCRPRDREVRESRWLNIRRALNVRNGLARESCKDSG